MGELLLGAVATLHVLEKSPISHPKAAPELFDTLQRALAKCVLLSQRLDGALFALYRQVSGGGRGEYL